MVAVSAPRTGESLAENAPCGRVHDIAERAVCQIQLADTLLRKDRESIVAVEHTDVSGSRKSKTVTDTDGPLLMQDLGRSGEREHLAERVCILMYKLAADIRNITGCQGSSCKAGCRRTCGDENVSVTDIGDEYTTVVFFVKRGRVDLKCALHGAEIIHC